MVRRLFTLGSVVAALVVPLTSAIAAPPKGSCAPPFTPISRSEYPVQFPLLIEVFGEDAIAQFDVVDANNNGIICYQHRPSWSTSYVTHTALLNIVDDTAAPHSGS